LGNKSQQNLSILALFYEVGIRSCHKCLNVSPILSPQINTKMPITALFTAVQTQILFLFDKNFKFI